MEDVKKGVKYSFTLNPGDIRNFKNKGDTSLMYVRNPNIIRQRVKYAVEMLEEYHSHLIACTYELYPELSPTGRLHFHGTIEINDVFNFFYHDLVLFQNGSVYEIDTIKDPDVWTTYCTKQKGIMETYWQSAELTYPMIYPKPKADKKKALPVKKDPAEIVFAMSFFGTPQPRTHDDDDIVIEDI